MYTLSKRRFATYAVLLAGVAPLLGGCDSGDISQNQAAQPRETQQPAAQSAAVKDFSAAKKQVFSVHDSGSLDIEVFCPVTIVPGNQNQITVAIDADAKDAANFELTQEGDTVSVRETGGYIVMGNGNIYNPGSNSINITGGYNMIGGSGVTQNNSGGNNTQNIIINGQRVVSGTPLAVSTKVPHLTITLPSNASLSAMLSGASVLDSSVMLGEASLDMSGQVTARLESKSLNVHASGQADVKATVNGGDLDIDASGQGEFLVRGEFSKVKIDLSGMVSVITAGPVAGTYTAYTSGMSNIAHEGSIRGLVHKRNSGMSSIDVH